jgi:hypothetical protein
VNGIVKENGFVICKAPRHEIGVCQLQFWKDKTNWFGTKEFSFTVAIGLESFLVFASVGVIMKIICVIGVGERKSGSKYERNGNC